MLVDDIKYLANRIFFNCEALLDEKNFNENKDLEIEELRRGVANIKKLSIDLRGKLNRVSNKNQKVIAEGIVRNNLVGGITLVDEGRYVFAKVFAKDIVPEKLIEHIGKPVKLILEVKDEKIK